MFGKSANLYYVGKRSSNHALSQDAINQLMVRLAKEGQQVVRLKGGDPCIFGRGGEEALYLSRAGVPFQLVPGISSVHGIAAMVGIPLTHREVAGQFLVLEGHDLSADFICWPRLAEFDGTMVWLMASKKTKDIATQLLAHGADPQLPIALVESQDYSRPDRVNSTLAAAAKGLLPKRGSGPGIVYIGKTLTLFGCDFSPSSS